MSYKKTNPFALLDSDSDNETKLSSNIDSNNNNNNNNGQYKHTIKNNKEKHIIRNDLENNKFSSNKFEEDVMNQFYGKKIYNKHHKYNNTTNTFNTSNTSNTSNTTNISNISNITNSSDMNNSTNTQNEFIKVINKKKETKMMIECKYKNIENNLENIVMENNYNVLAHHNDDKSWDYNSYFNMTCLKTWGDIATFFNTISTAKGECNYTDFDLFVMKNEISPMWEDKENRSGSICSVKIDSLFEANKIFKNLVVHMANNTLLKFNPSTWNTVNGISFSSKKLDNATETYYTIIKIWFKINILNYPSIDKLLNDDINHQINKYSIKNRQIKPEY